MNSKIETYIGFAIKKGSAVLGCDSIKKCRKKVYLLLATKTLSQNSLDFLQKASEKFRCEVVVTEDYNNLKQKNCKALAICDKSLANAIQQVANQEVKLEETNGKHNK